MFQLLCFRPEAAKVTPPATFEPFSGIESLGLFETEEAVNSEIDYWQKREGQNWKFCYWPAPAPLAKGWCEIAAALGASHAHTAATWVTDGNESDESRAQKLKYIQEGDPAMYQYLPRRPDLSGELSDSYDAATLIEEVTGRNAEDVDHEDRETIVGAWENAVDEHFVSACEVELMKWVND